MSFCILLINQGWQVAFFSIWLNSWKLAFPIAWMTAITIAIPIQKLVTRIMERG